MKLALDSESKVSTNESDHFLTIVNEIKHRLEPPTGGKRSVLVFFKDLPTLKRFYVSRSAHPSVGPLPRRVAMGV